MQEKLLIIFGITGDLAQRKIIPSLYEIRNRTLNDKFKVVGIGRQNFTQDEFHNYLGEKINEIGGDSLLLNDFLKNIDYFKVELTNEEYYQKLKEYIETNKNKFSEIIVYLAISPDLFQPVLINFKKYDIHTLIDRVAFEKPFGFDLNSSVELNNKVLEVFEEKKVYRIDHYLGKEATQNIIAFRFSNIFFENIWNSEYIDNIQIIASEKLGVLNRGEYYDNYGALRDMLQNHILQVLSLVTMEHPADLSADSIKDEKVKVIKSLKLDKNFENDVVYGQYKGYKEEKGVKNDSRTETFAAMKLNIDNGKFKGVPIYLKTGKNLDQKMTHVIVEFKSLPFNLYNEKGNLHKNKIIFDLGNKEGIYMDLNVKEYGESNKISTVRSSFNENTYTLDGYYRLLLDLLNGESLLFTRWDMIEESWKLVDTLINCKDNCPVMQTYEPGSKGPQAADRLMEKDGRKWNH